MNNIEQNEEIIKLEIPEFLRSDKNNQEKSNMPRIYHADDLLYDDDFDDDAFGDDAFYEFFDKIYTIKFKIIDTFYSCIEFFENKFHIKSKLHIKEEDEAPNKYIFDINRDKDKFIGEKILNINTDGKPEFYNYAQDDYFSPKYDISDKKILNGSKYIDIQIGEKHINYHYDFCFNTSSYTTIPIGKISSHTVFCKGKWRNLNYKYQEIIGATVTDIKYTETPATEKPYTLDEDICWNPQYINAIDELEIFLDNNKKIVIHHTKETSSFRVINKDEKIKCTNLYSHTL